MKARSIWTNTTYLQDKSMQNYIIRILPRIIIRIYYQELYTLKTLGVCYSLKNAFFNW